MEKKQERNNMEVANNMNIEKKLKRILNLFFRMKPRNKFWLLEVLLLAKRGELVICNNEIEADDFILCVVDTSILAVTGGTEKTLQDWDEKGIRVKYAVGRTTAEINKLFSEINNTFSEREQSHNNIFAMKQMEPLDLMEIVHILCSLPDDWFQSGVGIFTEEVLSYIARSEGKAGEFFQPIQVTRLMMRLLGATEGSVYNPYAGLASYGTFLSNKVDYYAQEISPIYLIARLNLLLHGKSDSHCVQGNSVSDWLEQSFDYIVATPPFNARISNSNHDTMEADFFAKAYSQAQKKVAAIVSGWFCAATSGLSFSIRKTLIEKDLVESVIRLPNNLFYGTNIAAYVVILNREKEQKGKVRFVDASECFKKQGINNLLDEEVVISLLQSEDANHSTIVDKSIFFSNGCSFIPERYIARMLLEAKDGERTIALEHILQPCSRKEIELKEGQHPIVIFPFPKLQLSIKSSDIPKKDVNAHVPACQIEEDCIIVDTRRQPRSVYVKLDGSPAYYMPYYRAFKVDTSVVLPEYLVIQLRQPYMAKQIVDGTGSIVSRGLNVLFMTAKILLPSLDEQRTAVIRYKEQLLQEMGIHFNELNEKRLEDFAITQRERKHAVSQVLDDILPAIELIDDYIQHHDSFSKGSVVSRRGTTFEEYISKLVANINKVSDMVEHFTDSDKFHNPVPLNMKSAICAYIEKKITDGYEVIMEYLDEGDMTVNISKEDLHQVLDNLIKNADKYGFLEKDKRKDYQVKITATISEDGQMAIVHVRNNGIPASRDFDIKRIFAWGEGHGTGIGCNQVKLIVEHFGGTVTYNELNDDPNGFVCDFEIVLPLNNDSSND
ncbi:MAG: N-6 DNA methylase [Bacteroidaceae bacterium]|nr:N-6 DNA methylase [Bacteroidaceae bacterium]